MVASLCPTGCDADCDNLCHEWHQVVYKQDHNPTMCEVRAHLVHLLRTAQTAVEQAQATATRAFAPPGAIDALNGARRYRDGIARCVEELDNVAC